MEQTTETQLILNGLYRDRAELTKQLSDVERLIKKIKLGTFSFDIGNNNAVQSDELDNTPTNKPESKAIDFPLRGELRVQVISIIDSIGVVCELKLIQDKHKEMTGFKANLRETVRNLYKHQILALLKPKGTERGLYWVKSEWLENDGTKLKEQHKFDGFNLLYSDEDLEYLQ